MNVVKLRKHKGKASRQSSLFEPTIEPENDEEINQVDQQREAHYTPGWCVDLLEPYLDDPWLQRTKVVDAGAGSGNITRALLNKWRGASFVCIEPIAEQGIDHTRVRWERSVFVTDAKNPVCPDGLDIADATLVISNPPFSLAEAFALASFNACPQATVAILQRRGWVDEARTELFRTHAPDEFVIPKRIPFLFPDGREQAPFPGLCSWYVWPPGGGNRREGRWVWLDSPVNQMQLV